MIYLVITASLTNRFGANTQRTEEYVSAIRETLLCVPSSISVIIVENNGKRPTELDQFMHDGTPISVHYTDHNQREESKGVTEMRDLHSVIRAYRIQDTDRIIKLTGRYALTSSFFLKDVVEHESEYEVWMKFYNVSLLRADTMDCILGCYAMQVSILLCFSPLMMDRYASYEVAMARYVRSCGVRVKEMDSLGVRCHFADRRSILDV